MALPACFHLADDVFPRVRAEAARRLVGHGVSQTRIAARLGVSQAMISKYARQPAATQPLVVRLAEDLLATLDEPAHGPSLWCSTLSIQQERPGAEAALADMLAAERRLLECNPLAIMPEVGLNLARCLPDATKPDEVLAYPARIVAAGQRLVRPVPPAYGASNHLSACLLALRRQDPETHAIANIRGGSRIRDAAGAPVELQGEGPRDALYAAAVERTPARLVHDPGAVGYEPCLYVAGATAVDVVETILRIADEVGP